ncbi:MAG: hypothetical protein IMZ43_01050 [Thermoplasmata archaeon]|nr:hypothetical protein [Thermoplasmata archaeon]
MGIAGSYHSQTKQRIRELLWDAAFEDLINREKKEIHAIKYFDLPGPECIYIRQLIKKYNLPKENIFAVEQYEHCGIQIRNFLAGKSTVFIGKLEELIEKKELDPIFPSDGFDVVNLDFCGQGFVFPEGDGEDYQKRWDVIKYFIDKNHSKGKELFYLLFTLLGVRSNKEGRKYLIEQIKELNELSGLLKEPSNWNEDELVQNAAPNIIIDLALKKDYKTTFIDSYRYQQEDHKSKMVTFSLKLEAIKGIKLGNEASLKAQLLKDSVMLYYPKDQKHL